MTSLFSNTFTNESFLNSSCQSAHENILVKLITSVNRADGPDAAKENLAVTLKLHKKYPEIIKGMDLSGDPLKYAFLDFAPVFTEARSEGLGIAIHAAEVMEKYEDVKDILDFGPDRIGHGTFVEGKLLVYLLVTFSSQIEFSRVRH